MYDYTHISRNCYRVLDTQEYDLAYGLEFSRRKAGTGKSMHAGLEGSHLRFFLLFKILVFYLPCQKKAFLFCPSFSSLTIEVCPLA